MPCFQNVFTPKCYIASKWTVIIPTKAFARDYGITGVHLSVRLSVCLSVCLFVTTITK